MATDRLTLARALEEGGIPRDAAEHIATEIFDAIHDNVATKADIESVKSDIENVRAELLLCLSELEHRMILRVGSMIVAATGIPIAIHYIH